MGQPLRYRSGPVGSCCGREEAREDYYVRLYGRTGSGGIVDLVESVSLGTVTVNNEATIHMNSEVLYFFF